MKIRCPITTAYVIRPRYVEIYGLIIYKSGRLLETSRKVFLEVRISVAIFIG